MVEKTETPAVKLSNEETLHNGIIINNLYRAKNDRDTNHREFNNLSYINWFNNNEKIANTEIVIDETIKIYRYTLEQ